MMLTNTAYNAALPALQSVVAGGTAPVGLAAGGAAAGLSNPLGWALLLMSLMGGGKKDETKIVDPQIDMTGMFGRQPTPTPVPERPPTQALGQSYQDPTLEEINRILRALGVL